MKSTTLIMLLGSFGFLVIGFISLVSKKIKKYFKESGVYKDTDKFMYYNGVFNLAIGLIGTVVSILDMILVDKSKYIIAVYIIVMFILATIQNKLLKKYRNI